MLVLKGAQVVTGEGQSFDGKMAVTPSRWRTKLERVLRAVYGWRAGVLDFDPVWRPSGPVRPVFVLRYQALQPHQAGMAKQVRAYLALLEVAQEDAVHPPRQELREAGFSCRVPGCRTMLPP